MRYFCWVLQRQFLNWPLFFKKMYWCSGRGNIGGGNIGRGSDTISVRHRTRRCGRACSDARAAACTSNWAFSLVAVASSDYQNTSRSRTMTQPSRVGACVFLSLSMSLPRHCPSKLVVGGVEDFNLHGCCRSASVGAPSALPAGSRSPQPAAARCAALGPL